MLAIRGQRLSKRGSRNAKEAFFTKHATSLSQMAQDIPTVRSTRKVVDP